MLYYVKVLNINPKVKTLVSILLEVLQLGEEVGLGRDEIRLRQQRAEMVGGELAFLVEQRHGLAHVQDAGHLVDLAFVHQQLVVVAGHQLPADRLR